ncbi:MAG: hypothetical protein NTZ09_02500, partial [Candidatus Hydrogenedentes bacterium]|nr:hypothetical protein [Candidatus Hydrogenedentota bacterium]
VFTPTDTAHYSPVSGTTDVTVNKATPAITTQPTASPITYGQTLAASTLTGGSASTPGTFVFDAPNTVLEIGVHSTVPVTFTPTDADNYNSAPTTVSVTVNKATPVVNPWPAASPITYGQTLAASTLTGGTSSVPGTFAFTAPNTAPNAGNHPASVTFTPTDTVHYGTAEGEVIVVVYKATPVVTTWPTATPITYGQTLADSSLPGGSASVTGTFVFNSPSMKPNAGTYAAAVTFTPTDAANYNAVPRTVNVVVNKATPTVTTWPTASDITYGDTLASSTLSGGAASTSGWFAFDAPETEPEPGEYPGSVTFTPSEAMNYNTVPGTVNVHVKRGVWYVKSGIAGDGYSWETACGSIQQAVDAAYADHGGDVWVAKGNYVADALYVIVMAQNVYVYGGFGGDDGFDDRDWETNPTVLDGESEHGCVKGANGAGLDGFIIINGAGESAGGMLNDATSPSVSNCGFYANAISTAGGGMRNIGNSSPTVTNCNFSGNTASTNGGGMYNWNSSPTVVTCNFTGNTAESGGGGMYNKSSSPTVFNCNFSGNTSVYGGGMHNSSDSLVSIVNCNFAENTVVFKGGGIINWYGSSSTVVNCTFVRNEAGIGSGGGIYVEGLTNLTNCTLTENTASSGGGLYSSSSWSTVTNCIFWGNVGYQSGNEVYGYSQPVVTYSCIKGGYEGTGNISSDPLFADPDNGDYSLQAGSPCIDTGTADGAPDEDILGVARPQGAGYDMGAYERPEE